MFIEVNGAKKQYGAGEAAVFALDGVDLSLEKGKICVILGPSGSGKSTLLNMIGGLDSLDSGEIVIDGQNITKLNKKALTSYRKQSVGFIFQFHNLIPDLLGDHVRLYRRIVYRRQSAFSAAVLRLPGAYDREDEKHRG